MSILKEVTRFFSNKEVGIIFIYLMVMAAVPGMGFVAAAHLMLIALIKKKEWYFKSLVYFSILKHFNPIFHPPSTNLFLVFVIILFIIYIIDILSKDRLYFFKLEKRLYILMMLFALSSIIGSLYIEFSLIRITIITIFIFTVFQSLRRIRNIDLLNFIIRVSIILIIASAPLIFTGAGYMYGLFKGAIYHSQDFALILLPLLMVYLIAMLSHKIPTSFFHGSILLLGFFELFLSKSRAAMGGVIIALIFYYILKNKKKFKRKNIIVTLMLLLASILIFVQNPVKIESGFKSFFTKHKNIESYTDSVGERIMLLETAKENFLTHPLTGVGFNVQTYYPDILVQIHLSELIKYIPGTDIMYSRPLEKGNLYAGVFEEGGLIVGIFFLYVILYLLTQLYQSKTPYVWVPFVSMLFNFNGEASLFSPSGPGNFQLLIIVTLYIMALQQRKRINFNV